jgi:putative transposase
LLNISRSGYYRWLRRNPSSLELENRKLIDDIIYIYQSVNGIYGYRRITMVLNRKGAKRYNQKRIRRLMRVCCMKAVIRIKRQTYVASTPQVVADNILDRRFEESRSNEKWLSDVTELSYGNNKAYLCAILDLGDATIVSYALGLSNSNELVFAVLNQAMDKNPGAKPIFHSDRGYQFTSRTFHTMLDKAGYTQSMSRVGRCLDNGPMEGFWGIFKTEMYYLRKFTSFEELKLAVDKYMYFYNHERYRSKFKGLAPIEVRNQAILLSGEI